MSPPVLQPAPGRRNPPGEGRIPQSFSAITIPQETLVLWRQLSGWTSPMVGITHGGQHPWWAAPISASAAPREEPWQRGRRRWSQAQGMEGVSQGGCPPADSCHRERGKVSRGQCSGGTSLSPPLPGGSCPMAVGCALPVGFVTALFVVTVISPGQCLVSARQFSFAKKPHN